MKKVMRVKYRWIIGVLLAALFTACSSPAVPTVREELPLDKELPVAEPDDAPGEWHTATVYLPGLPEATEVGYEVIDGMAIFEGDILLGRVEESGELATQNVTTNVEGRLWPDAVIPFQIDTCQSGETSCVRAIGGVDNIEAAIQQWEQRTSIDFVAYDSSQHDDYVEFVQGSSLNACRSFVGRDTSQARQEIELTSNGTCTVGTLIHEIGHAVGLYHEQTRNDRNNFVTIQWANIQSGREGNFCRVGTSWNSSTSSCSTTNESRAGTDIGDYDFNSVMHYAATAFGIGGSTTITANDPTVTALGSNVLSEGDIAAVQALYPNEITMFHRAMTDVPGDLTGYERYGSAVAAGDFDADGFEDLAIGTPLAKSKKGSVDILYGTDKGLTGDRSQQWAQDSKDIAGVAEAGDRFGESLVSADFNGDGVDDLAIGVPFEVIGDEEEAGAVNVLYGVRGTGLSAVGNQVWHQNSAGILGVAEADDRFGRALAAGDFNKDGFDDLAVGVSGESVDSPHGSMGAVNILYGSRSGLSSNGNLLVHENTPGVSGTAEPSDFFGYQLAVGDFNKDGFDDLVVSTMQNSGTETSAGAVHILKGSGSGVTTTGTQYLYQGLGTLVGKKEKNDFFGSALTVGNFDGDTYEDLAIGSSGENYHTSNADGAVHMIYGAFSGLDINRTQIWSQDSNGVRGVAEAGDNFGATLAAGDFNADGITDLAVGAPGEDVSSNWDAGSVNILFGASGGMTSDNNVMRYQGNFGLSGVYEEKDKFASSLATGDFDGNGDDDLAIGVPGEDIQLTNSTSQAYDAGAVSVSYFFE